jgi:hypothetical protein
MLDQWVILEIPDLLDLKVMSEYKVPRVRSEVLVIPDSQVMQVLPDKLE